MFSIFSNKKKVILLFFLLILSLLTTREFYGMNNYISTNKKNITVAILDTGIDYEHKELQNVINKGFIGYNFICQNASVKDDNGHGTHVAGIVASTSDFKVNIITGKVLDLYGNGKIVNTIKGINWAVQNGAKIILISHGTPVYNKELSKAVYNAWNNGVLIIAAAGNTGEEKVIYPAGDIYALGVGAAGLLEKKETKFNVLSLSNRGRQVSIVAPGENIMSLMPGYNVYASKFGYKTQYTPMSGTSQAAAFVAGIAAKVWIQNPQLTNKELYQTLIINTINDEKGIWSYDKGYGMINITENISKQQDKIYGGVYGQIMYNDNNPIIGAEIMLKDAVFTTGIDGIFRISNFVPGEYICRLKIQDINYYGEFKIKIESGIDLLMPIIIPNNKII